MFTYIKQQKGKFLFSTIARLIVFVLSFSLIFSPTASYAQSILNLPIPGTMIRPSPAFVPVLLKGMTIHPDDPLKFDFIIDSGNTDFTTDEIKEETERLVKYFLASMTVPKDDLWVNLSPYEEDRIIPNELGKTELGRDMLAQDYILKQLTASLMYPEEELGKKFWDKVYKKAEEQFGTSEIPVNTFNKVWILPETATVYEHDQTVYIVDAHLKVMLDSDYEAMNHEKVGTYGNTPVQDESLEVSESIIREIIIPEIEREVNEGQHFAPLRQIYHSLILAKWYKETVKNSLLSQVYVDKNLIAGVESGDETIKDQIYAQYMEAYKKGVFNYIKEDYDALSQEMIPRKYFSGGLNLDANIKLRWSSSPVIDDFNGKGYKMTVINNPQKKGASSPISILIDQLETFSSPDPNDPRLSMNSGDQEKLGSSPVLGEAIRIVFFGNLYELQESLGSVWDVINAAKEVAGLSNHDPEFVRKAIGDNSQRVLETMITGIRNIAISPQISVEILVSIGRFANLNQNGQKLIIATVKTSLESGQVRSSNSKLMLFYMDLLDKLGARLAQLPKSTPSEEIEIEDIFEKRLLRQAQRLTDGDYNKALAFILQASQAKGPTTLGKPASSPVSGEQIVEEFRRQDYFGLLRLPMFRFSSINRQDIANLEKAILRIAELGNDENPLTVNGVKNVVTRALDVFDQKSESVDLAVIVAFEVIHGVAIEKKNDKYVFGIWPTHLDDKGLPPAFANWMTIKMAEGQSSLEMTIELARFYQSSSPVSDNEAMKDAQPALLPVSELSRLKTFSNTKQRFKHLRELTAFEDYYEKIIIASKIPRNRDITNAQWVYRGMRLVPEKLLDILTNGMEISEHYGMSAFMTRLELAVSKSLSSSGLKSQIPLENFIPVIFQVKLKEIQEEMGRFFETDNIRNSMIEKLGIEYRAFGTISPKLLKHVWVFDGDKKKYALLDLKPAKTDSGTTQEGIDKVSSPVHRDYTVYQPAEGIRAIRQRIAEIIKGAPEGKKIFIKIMVDGSGSGIGKSTFAKTMARNINFPGFENFEFMGDYGIRKGSGGEIHITEANRLLSIQGLYEMHHIPVYPDANQNYFLVVYLANSQEVNQLIDRDTDRTDFIIEHDKKTRIKAEQMAQIWQSASSPVDDNERRIRELEDRARRQEEQNREKDNALQLFTPITEEQMPVSTELSQRILKDSDLLANQLVDQLMRGEFNQDKWRLLDQIKLFFSDIIPDDETRAGIFAMIQERVAFRIGGQLQQFFESPDSRKRSKAVHLVGELKNVLPPTPQALEALAEKLFDENMEVRIAAAWSLGVITAPETRGGIEEELGGQIAARLMAALWREQGAPHPVTGEEIRFGRYMSMALDDLIAYHFRFNLNQHLFEDVFQKVAGEMEPTMSSIIRQTLIDLGEDDRRWKLSELTEDPLRRLVALTYGRLYINALKAKWSINAVEAQQSLKEEYLTALRPLHSHQTPEVKEIVMWLFRELEEPGIKGKKTTSSPIDGISPDQSSSPEAVSSSVKNMPKKEFSKVPFEMYVGDFLFSISKLRAAIMDKAKQLGFIPVKNFDNFNDIISTIMQNLWQHESEKNFTEVFMRIFYSKDPVEGLRIEFWGAGKNDLPKRLIQRRWFDFEHPPWTTFMAPADSIVEGDTHIGISEIFDSAKSEFLESKIRIYFSWRNNTGNEGGKKEGHIIALHIPFKRAKSKKQPGTSTSHRTKSRKQPSASSSPVNENEQVGGIDMNEINVDHQGSGVDIQFNPVEIQEIIDMGITGFAPVIINLTPLPSILPLLGLAPQKEEEFEVSSLN